MSETDRATRSPRRLLLHVLTVVVVATMAVLGAWQLARHGEVRSHNALIGGRIDDAPVRLRDIPTPSDPDAIDHVPVTVTGVYARDGEVLIRSRAHRGQNGFHVVTPLVVDGDSVVLVNRGWIPLERPGDGAFAAPAGEVTVVGSLQPSQEAGFLGARDPEEGQLEVAFRIDIDRLAPQLGVPDVFPGYVQLASQQPAQVGDLPIPVAPPELDAGPHLGYALQWFALGLVALTTYAIFLRRRPRAAEPGYGP